MTCDFDEFPSVTAETVRNSTRSAETSLLQRRSSARVAKSLGGAAAYIVEGFHSNPTNLPRKIARCLDRISLVRLSGFAIPGVRARVESGFDRRMASRSQPGDE